MQTRKLSLPIVFFLFLSLFSNLVYAAELFNDGFESGDTTGWTGETKGAGCTLTVAAAHAHTGSYGLESYRAAWQTATYVYETLGASEASLNVRAYFYIHSGGPTTTTYGGLISFRNVADSGTLASAMVYNDSGTFRPGVKYGASYVFDADGTISTGAWHCVELAAAYGSSGTIKFYLDGTEMISQAYSSAGSKTAKFYVGQDFSYGGTGKATTIDVDCAVAATSYIGVESSALNLSFNLTAIPTVTTTLNKGIEIFKALSGAPAFTSSITYGLEWLFNLDEIPAQTATLVYGRALAFGLSEIPKFIADLAYEFQLKAGKNLYFNLSIIPQIIVDMTVQKGKELTFNLSIIGAFIADLTKNQEIFRSLSETPKFIVDMTREIELAFVEFVLLEVPIFTATLGYLVEAGMTTSDLANGAIALALIALVFAVCGIGLAVKKAKD